MYEHLESQVAGVVGRRGGEVRGVSEEVKERNLLACRGFGKVSAGNVPISRDIGSSLTLACMVGSSRTRFMLSLIHI